MKFPTNLVAIAIALASLSACAGEDAVPPDQNIVIVETSDFGDEIDNELLQADERGVENLSEKER
jgi:hypothetical protein